MKVQDIPIDQINPAPYNPRQDLQPGDPTYEKLSRSIDEFGTVEPVVWNRRTGHLVGGHQRFKILTARGDRAVCAVVIDEPLAREKALNIALNKIDGAWDEAKLGSLLAELVEDCDLDTTLTGFGGAEIEQLLVDCLGEGVEDFDLDHASEETEEPITKPGDLIELGQHGEHRLICGDVTGVEVVQRVMREHLASMLFTDPPYGVRYDPKNRPSAESGRKPASGKRRTKTSPRIGRATDDICNDDLTPKQYAAWFPRVLDAVAPWLMPGGAYYIWNAHRHFALMHGLLAERKLKVASTLVWAKESFSPGFGDYNEQVEFCLYGCKGGARHRWYGPRNASTLWEVHRDRTRDYRHPTQKPLELAERAIRNSSRRGEIVLDPFLGSGTTLLAAQLLGRRCFGLEVDPRHCDTIVRRYIALVGESAVAPEIAEKYRLVESGVA